MKQQFKYCIVICFLFNSFFTSAQTMAPRLRVLRQNIASALTNYYKKYPREKVFLHTDQNVYLGKETIWYKAYSMAYGKPSQLSKIVYVRLSDARGEIIAQNKMPLKNSTAYGNIDLPDSLATGWYNLRAFTAWMLNFDAAGIYNQKIFIKNLHNSVNHALPVPHAKNYYINFFPEGGDLVDGALCNVAFKAVDENGLPVNVSGEISADDQKPIAKLLAIHDGMGSFELEADANLKYTAKVHFPDSSTRRVELPAIKKASISIRVNRALDNELELKITNNGEPDHKDVILAAVQNNGSSVLYPLRLSRGINIFHFKKSAFYTGILRLTVFDENGLPLAERVAFIDNKDQLRLFLTKNTLSFNPKSENEFTVNLKDKEGQTANANLSVSVTDAVIGSEPDDNICSYFLVSSELPGYIHQPGYYFRNNSDTLQHQLDLVMLTNGWRHFKWETLLNEKSIKLNYFVENTQVIAGKIENYHDKDNFRVNLLITNSDSSKKAVTVNPDSKGFFVLKDYNQQGPATISYEVVNRKNNKQPAKITFIKSAADTVVLPPDTLNQIAGLSPVVRKTLLDSVSYVQNIDISNKGIILKMVTVKGRKLTAEEELVKTHVRRFEADHAFTFDLVNNYTYPTADGILGFLQGRVPGLQIIMDPVNGIHFSYHGKSSIITNEQPVFYVDEAISTIDEITGIPMNDIALVRFVPPPVWFAPLNGGSIGAILIYTKIASDDVYVHSSKRALGQYVFNGYSVTREFPLPDLTKHTTQPDYRTTLFWNHDLKTDSYGSAKIHFYNSDKARKYRVIVQAMDADGQIGFLNETF